MHRRRAYVMVADRGKKSVDERFTDLADSVSELIGKWWVSLIAALMIGLWTIYCAMTQGPSWWYGQYYNFPLNLVTTVAELFLAFILAAAANRLERRNREMLDQQTSILAHNQAMHEKQLRLLELVEQLVARDHTELQYLTREVEQQKEE